MPGTSGVLSPCGKINGLYFNNSREPDNYEFDFKKDLSKLMEDDDATYIQIKADTKEAFYKILDTISEFNKNCLIVTGTTKNKETIIIEKDTDNEEETEAP